MCGVAGLFVGCELAAICPSAAAVNTDEPAAGAYRSPFDSWYEKASVRSAPRRVLSDDPAVRHLFSPELVPLVQHPEVQALEDQFVERAVVNHTYRYLNFTTVLEALVVNPVAGAISRGSLGFPVPAQMRLDAHKISCDESYHALFSADLTAQIEARTGINPASSEAPYFVDRLAAISATVEPSRLSLVNLLFVICSEMLITATLRFAQPSPGVEPAVTEAVRDHASDEGRHHSYFQQLLSQLWSHLSASERRFASRTMPLLISAFMEPDRPALVGELRTYGFGSDDARRILDEVLPHKLVATSAAAAAAHIVRALRELDAFDDLGTVDAFDRIGVSFTGSR